MPITSDRAWLDWDTAVSIVGHDVAIKETYACLLSGRTRPEVFIDIGANYGTHSLLFLANGIETITFEPNPCCHDYFKRVCLLNKVDYHLEPVALGEVDGMVEIKFPEKETWLGSTDPEIQKELEREHDLRVECVSQRRLDDYSDRFEGRRILMKIDTEGNEGRVLRGAVRIVDKCRPLIIFESTETTRRPGLYDFFAAVNYDVMALPWAPNASAPLLTDEAFLACLDTNYIAVPADYRTSWGGN